MKFNSPALLSSQLLSLHLPTSLLLSHLTLLGSTYLLRTGSFASNLITELHLLRTRPQPISRTHGGISNLDLNRALIRSSIGTELDEADDLEDQSPTSSLGLEGFALVFSREEDMAEDPFSKRLVGPSITLKYVPSRAMGLIMTKDCLEVYGRIWGYLMGIRACHSRLLSA